MTISDRDRRALIILGAALVLALIYWMAGSTGKNATTIAAPVDNIDRTEKRLAILRASLATVSGKETVLHQVQSELAEREKGLIPGDTAEQAQAQLLQIARRVTRAQTPPIEIKQSELGQPRAYGDAYGQVLVSVTMECRVDELINLLAEVSQQPEMIATEDIRISNANQRSKAMTVRLTLAGIVPRRLVPQKKGPQQGVVL